VVEILQLHHKAKCTSLANQMGDFAVGVLSGCTASVNVPTLHLLGFLQEVSMEEEEEEEEEGQK